jgi:hypothetical protein
MSGVVDLWCLACGGPIEPVLARLASPCCHDCRDDDMPLDAHLVAGRPPATDALDASPAVE